MQTASTAERHDGRIAVVRASAIWKDMAVGVSWHPMKRAFIELDDRELLALAVSLEEEDGRIYADFAEGMRKDFPATAAVFDQMREAEVEHRQRLLALYRQRFGEHIPLIRREDVKGFVERRPVWLMRPLKPGQKCGIRQRSWNWRRAGL